MSKQSCEISALSTLRLGSLLKDDFAPSVAASLVARWSAFFARQDSRSDIPEQTKPAVTTGEQLSREEHEGEVSPGS